MIKENNFAVFILCSFLVHTVLWIGWVLEPFAGFFDKTNVPLIQTVRINSISSLTESQKNNELPLKQNNISSNQTKKQKSKKSSPKKIVLSKKKHLKNKKQQKPKKPAISKKQTIKDIKQKQSQALDKLSALESIEKIKQEMAEPNKKPSLSTTNNQNADSTLDFQTLQYLIGLKSHINMYWNLPQELANQNLRTQVYVEINKAGYILQAKILQSSSNEDFDSRVLETINKASPFPSPSTKKMENLVSKGIVFNFPN